jgi:hypothetical protein
LEEEEPLDYGQHYQATFGSDSDPEGLDFDFEQQTPTHRYRDNGDPAQLQLKKQRRPQFPEQDLGLRARSVLTDQSLALKEDRHRTNSLESTSKMATGGRHKGGQKQHTQYYWSIIMAKGLLLIPLIRTLWQDTNKWWTSRKLGLLRKRQNIRPKLKSAIKLRPS